MTINGNHVIIDAKYKTPDFKPENKYGISQSDMYQMVTYAIRRRSVNNILLYPYHLGEESANPIKFEVCDMFHEDNKEKINSVAKKTFSITAAKIPVIIKANIESSECKLKAELKEIFSSSD